MKKSSFDSILHKASHMYISRLSQFLGGFFIWGYFSSKNSPAIVGITALLISSAIIAGSLSNLGFNFLIIQKQNSYFVKVKTVRLAILSALIASFIIGVIGWSLNLYLVKEIRELSSISMFLWYFFLILGIAWSAIIESIQLKTNAELLISVRSILTVSIRVFLIYFFPIGAQNFIRIYAGSTLATLFVTSILNIMFYSEYFDTTHSQSTKTFFYEYRDYSDYFFLFVAVQIWGFRDYIIQVTAAKLLSIDFAGLIFIINLITVGILIIPYTIGFSTYVELSSTKRFEVVKRTLLLIVFIVVFSSLLIGLLAPYILKLLWSNPTRQDTLIMRIILISVVPQSINMYFFELLRAYKAIFFSILISVLRIFFITFFTLLFAFYFDIIGVALSLVFTEVFLSLVMFIGLAKTSS